VGIDQNDGVTKGEVQMTTKSIMFAARRGFLLVPIAIALAWFALSPARAVSPAPDGGYPNENTAEGTDALFSLISGFNNTAMGFQALFRNTSGSANTANGAFALISNTTGFRNTAMGFQALFSNTTGRDNTANGTNALELNTTGEANTANGNRALFSNTTGGGNTANGSNALSRNTTGLGNTANGIEALLNNTIGNFNTADGNEALFRNTTGSHNTAIGLQALSSNTTGSNNIALGAGAGTVITGNNNIDIDNSGVSGESNNIRIGTVGRHQATFIAGIRGRIVPGGIGVFVATNGQLGTFNSSERFKEAIKPMDKASEAILALKPVTFRYKHELDPEGIPQFGLVAEQVEKVSPDLVARDDQGKVSTVRYEVVNAMLLNEFLKEHRKVQELEATIAQQQKDFAQQQKEIKALTASLKEQALQIRKVRAASLR
jgi:Chaperone of endosialidase